MGRRDATAVFAGRGGARRVELEHLPFWDTHLGANAACSLPPSLSSLSPSFRLEFVQVQRVSAAGDSWYNQNILTHSLTHRGDYWRVLEARSTGGFASSLSSMSRYGSGSSSSGMKVDVSEFSFAKTSSRRVGSLLRTWASSARILMYSIGRGAGRGLLGRLCWDQLCIVLGVQPWRIAYAR